MKEPSTSTETEPSSSSSSSSVHTTTYIQLQPSQIMPHRAARIPRTPRFVTISWPERDQGVWQKFMEMCRRDGHSASSEIIAFVKAELARRGPGNPQTPLERYEKTPKEELQSMTLAQLSLLYEDVKARVRQLQLPSDKEILRFRLIQAEMNKRDRLSRLR